MTLVFPYLPPPQALPDLSGIVLERVNSVKLSQNKYLALTLATMRKKDMAKNSFSCAIITRQNSTCLS
jgi:hypothetical protein